MKPRKVIGSGAHRFSSPKGQGVLIGIGILVVVGLGASGYALWQNLGASAGGTSTLGRGWTTLGPIQSGGLEYAAAASICKIADPAVASGVDLEGKIEITSGASTALISAGVYTTAGATWATGNTIAATAGNVSTTALTSSVDSSSSVGVVLYGPDYTTVSAPVLIADMQSCS